MAGPSDKILLVLDLDETLVHATEQPLGRPPDFTAGPYSVYRRPHLGEFLRNCSGLFDLAFWSSAGDAYVAAVVSAILPAGVRPVLAWGRSRCVRRLDPETREDYFVKDLGKVRRQGYNLNRILAVDDSPRKLERHYGNAVYVRPYLGEPEDAELVLLARYLASLHTAENVRGLEKRGWREQARAGDTSRQLKP
jgi:RNA polymerase II subunit A small phosphatase-like protein